MASEFKLTLNPVIENPTPEAAAEAQAVAEQVEQDKEGLWTMRALARNMAYLLKCQQAARAAGIALPVQEKGDITNFIR